MVHAANVGRMLSLADHHEVDHTLEFYEREAQSYYKTTVGLDVSGLLEKFTLALPSGGRILDAGSGSGRDTKYLLDHGYEVDAFDASPKLAALSSSLTGRRTRVEDFEHWSAPASAYDGIWAFASLLHVAREDLPRVVDQLANSLRPGGVIFASFKKGSQDIVDERGRRFTNFTVDAARALFADGGRFNSIDVWAERASAAHGEDTDWVYVMARRPLIEPSLRS
jgi:SAM-dependent methyltransferase